jgi:pyruvate,orthophosphate dikinase
MAKMTKEKKGAKTKYVYSFGDGKAEGSAEMKNELGGKGANIAEMTNIGIPVPPGFTINTDACTYFMGNKKHPEGLDAEVDQHLRTLEERMGTSFGDKENPLLVSVRSGARASMPGMMDTVLNIGLNDETVEGLAARTDNQRFAYDSYRRFIDMYGDVVMGVDHEHFEKILSAQRGKAGVAQDNELGVEDLKTLIADYKALIER